MYRVNMLESRTMFLLIPPHLPSSTLYIYISFVQINNRFLFRVTFSLNMQKKAIDSSINVT